MAAIDKRSVLAALKKALEEELERFTRRALDAAEAATHEENKPEGDKDMRSTEASYIARGQAERAKEIEAALLDDLNTPQALAALAELASASRRAAPSGRKAAKIALLGAGDMLGLLKADPEAWFKQGLARASESAAGDGAIDAAEIDALVAKRTEARKARDFTEADRIRDLLAAKGIAIEDGAEGTRWKVVNPNECAA